MSFDTDDRGVFDWRRASRVTLGHDVWIGHGAVVLPGRSIGAGAAIGAGTVVTRDVPPFAVVAGNPGRVLRLRFPPEVRHLGAAEFCARYDPGPEAG